MLLQMDEREFPSWLENLLIEMGTLQIRQIAGNASNDEYEVQNDEDYRVHMRLRGINIIRVAIAYLPFGALRAHPPVRCALRAQSDSNSWYMLTHMNDDSHPDPAGFQTCSFRWGEGLHSSSLLTPA